MHSSASVSLGSVAQYAFLAGVAYLLAGAPLLDRVAPYLGTTIPTTGSASVGVPYQLENLALPTPGLNCTEHSHKGVFVLNREPLVVYIEGFVKDEEAQEIVKLR